ASQLLNAFSSQAHLMFLLISGFVLDICLSYADNNAFAIRHEKTNTCIKVKNREITAGDCRETKETLWAWVSEHRLFNLGSQKCLGLDTKSQNTLKIVDCDSDLLTLWWRCVDAAILTESEKKLTLKNGIVSVSIDASDIWRRSNSSDSICKLPYHVIYTRDGNSNGKPCEFPFLMNKTWHHDCIRNGMFEDGLWCSTTSNFDTGRKWGFCLKPEDGCQNTWEHDADSGSCYQVNTQGPLSWKEAYISCQRQGGDLLSITSASELHYIQAKDDIADMFWIGLNQLDNFGGWQWSDHTPLNFLSWSPEMKDSSPLDGTACAIMDANKGDWKSYACETALPYVCKKQFNRVQNYEETQCDSNWYPHNGFCYMLMNASASWKDAYHSCSASSSSLISINSLADVELLVTQIHNGKFETKDKVWTGFINEEVPALFKWSDGSDVVFTYWDQNEPKIPSNSTPNCVAYSGKWGRWNVLHCDDKLKYVCMKKGKVLDKPKPVKDCPTDGEWKKHGNFCYKVEENEVSFGKSCNLTIGNRFEQEFINSLIRKYSRVEEKYFWTGLQDIKSSGEYSWGSVDGTIEMLTYANWGRFEPALLGGCVAMSSGKYLGKWEVKNCKTFKAYSICKKYIGPKRKPDVPPKVTDPCPEGWHSGSGLVCYKFFHKERVLRTRTWEEAERFCEALGGHLPSFSHVDEMRELHTTLREIISDDRWVWVGLNKRNPESPGSWQWSDDKPVSTVVMSPEFREDDYDTRDCAAVKVHLNSMWSFHLFGDREEDFYLKPFHCGAKLEWVCQISKGITPEIPEWYKPDEVGIHGPALIIDGSEFWFVPEKHLSYQEASAFCSKNDSDLASVTSFTALTGILNRIANLSDQKQNWWLRYTPSTSRFHSLYVDPSIIIIILSYCISSLFFFPFTGNPNAKLPFICEKYNTSLLEAHDPNFQAPQRKCPENWFVFQDQCFQLVPPKDLTFRKASEYCHSYNGFLPSIKNQAEQDFITSLLPHKPPNIWIGLHFRVHTRENKWEDGSPLKYSNFHPLLQGRIRKFFDEEANNQCGVLLNDPKSSYLGTWNFTSCADTKSVAICQKNAEVAENQTQQELNVTVNYQNVTYTIILKALTWHEAQQVCLQNNMQLVSITEQYQQAFLAAQAAHHNYPLWIGLSSKDDGIHYHWSDKKHISFSRWSEEDGDLIDSCVYLDTDGLWKTADCYSEKPGTICYQPTNETETSEAYYDSIKCPHKIKNTPWIAFQNSCYTFVITKNRWKELKSDEAHHLCRNMNSNASLLIIRDEYENDFVVEQLQSFSGLAHWLWLGLVYEADDNALKWSDDTRLTYNNWRMGRPYIRNNHFVAGVHLDGFWDIYNDTRWLPFQFKLHSVLVCKVEMGPKEDKPPLPTLLPYKNTSYWILQKQINWYEAWKECKQNGRELASIHSESEQDFLKNIVKSDGFPLWIGLSNHNENDSDFEWSDGSTFDYHPREFEHSPPPGKCVVLDTKGLWNRVECTKPADGAVCYSPSNSKPAFMHLDVSMHPAGSPQWIQYKDNCYAFAMELYNYSIYTAGDAKEVCKKLDPSATLLTVKDAEENQFVSMHLKEYHYITGRAWLGIQSNAQSLKWLDGSEVKYTNWAKGNENVRGECSVILTTNGTWSKTDCKTGKTRVVCKAPQVANRMGGAIAVAVLFIVVLLAGLICFLYKKKRLHWSGFSSVRYERGMYEDETDSMFTRDGD
uniref:Lymphocyte antigen 75 n=1 Tax=Varanus komodoensis TaxID=61221 RepID=A0A8D2L7R1_VARKO